MADPHVVTALVKRRAELAGKIADPEERIAIVGVFGNKLIMRGRLDAGRS